MLTAKIAVSCLDGGPPSPRLRRTTFAWLANVARATSRERRLVRKRGFEPLRYCYRQPLKLVRLPVPPLPRKRAFRIFKPNWLVRLLNLSVLQAVRCSGSDLTKLDNRSLPNPRLSIWQKAGVNNARHLGLAAAVITRRAASNRSAADTSPSETGRLPHARAIVIRCAGSAVSDGVRAFGRSNLSASFSRARSASPEPAASLTARPIYQNAP